MPNSGRKSPGCGTALGSGLHMVEGMFRVQGCRVLGLILMKVLAVTLVIMILLP